MSVVNPFIDNILKVIDMIRNTDVPLEEIIEFISNNLEMQNPYFHKMKIPVSECYLETDDAYILLSKYNTNVFAIEYIENYGLCLFGVNLNNCIAEIKNMLGYKSHPITYNKIPILPIEED